MPNVNNRKDILLLLLYSPGRTADVNEPIVGRTRLVKMLFLFKVEALQHFRRGTEINEDNFYDFHPWDFGPFTPQVYDDVDFFLLRGFVESSIAQEEPLPESVAEWERWLHSTGISSEEFDADEFHDEAFRLAAKGVSFVEKRLYCDLSEAQKTHLREFKKRTVAVPLRALLRYVYENHEDFTTESRIRDDILGSARY